MLSFWRSHGPNNFTNNFSFKANKVLFSNIHIALLHIRDVHRIFPTCQLSVVVKIQKFKIFEKSQQIMHAEYGYKYIVKVSSQSVQISSSCESGQPEKCIFEKNAFEIFGKFALDKEGLPNFFYIIPMSAPFLNCQSIHSANQKWIFWNYYYDLSQFVTANATSPIDVVLVLYGKFFFKPFPQFICQYFQIELIVIDNRLFFWKYF